MICTKAFVGGGIMDIKDKKRIEQQLIAQANLIMEEESDVEIIANTLSACQALLRIIDKTVSTSISPQDFEDILAGYIGLTARVRYFYQNNNDYVIESNKNLVSQLLTEISSYQLQKNELDNMHEKKLDEYAETKRLYEDKQVEYDAFNEECNELLRKKSTLVEKVESLKKKKEQLLLEEDKLSSEIKEFEPKIEELTMSIMKLRDVYENLVAEYSEFERIRKGIENEGLVDIDNFNAIVRQKTDDGNTLIQWSENILNLLLEDIETLQAKVEKRRKAGA